MKITHRLYRIGALAGAILLPLGAVLATGTPEASASLGPGQYCLGISICLNAWNGGPFVNVYAGGPSGTPNNYFSDNCTFNNPCHIQDAGVNQSEGLCVGDAGNSPGAADTGLVGCTGWGTNFEAMNCAGAGVAFYNVHWGGYLGPPSGAVNGSHWYLNKPTAYCFLVFN